MKNLNTRSKSMYLLSLMILGIISICVMGMMNSETVVSSKHNR